MNETIEVRKRALSDPVRLKLLGCFRAPRLWTVKQLAEELGTKANSLYHHIRVLEAAGLVEIGGTTAEGRMVERQYRGVATTIISPEDGAANSDPLEKSLMLGAMLDAAKDSVQEALFEKHGENEHVAAQTDVKVVSLSLQTTRRSTRPSVSGSESLLARSSSAPKQFGARTTKETLQVTTGAAWK